MDAENIGTELVVGEKVGRDDMGPRVGGAFLKPFDLEWPTDSKNQPLTLVLSIPSSFLFPSGDRFVDHWVSVFVKYSESEFCLDAVTCNDSASFYDVVGETTKVLIHRPGEPVSKGVEITPRRIGMGKPVNQPVFQGSKCAGRPGYLHGNKMPIPEYLEFSLQVYSSDLSEEFSDLLGLADSVGYLFLPQADSNLDSGVFFSQCT